VTPRRGSFGSPFFCSHLGQRQDQERRRELRVLATKEMESMSEVKMIEGLLPLAQQMELQRRRLERMAEHITGTKDFTDWMMEGNRSWEYGWNHVYAGKQIPMVELACSYIDSLDADSWQKKIAKAAAQATKPEVNSK